MMGLDVGVRVCLSSLGKRGEGAPKSGIKKLKKRRSKLRHMLFLGRLGQLRFW